MSLQFLINVIDKATDPFKKITGAIDQSAQRFTNLDSRVDGANNSIHRLGNTANSTRSSLLGLSTIVAGAFSIAALTSFGRSVVDTTVKYQKMEAVLTTQLGSKAAGAQAMQMIQDFAASTPFQVDELTAAYVKLTSQGFQPTKTEMRSMGDIAASMGKSFDQLAEAVLDAQTGEFERLKEFGIKARAQGKDIAMTFKGQTTVIDKSAESMRRYLLSLGDAAGVTGSMANISETTGGKISNLGDGIDFLKKEMGEGLKPVIDTIVSALQKFIGFLTPVGKWMKENPAFIKWMALTLGIAAGALSLVTIGMWAFNAALWANPITWVVVAVLALAGGIAWLITKFDGWGTSISALWEIQKSFIKLAGLGFKQLWEGITFQMDMAWLKIKDFFQWLIEKTNNVLEAFEKLSSFDFEGAYEAASRKIETTASKEIAARQAEHENTRKQYAKDAGKELLNIGEQWNKVGLSTAKTEKKSAVESAVENLTTNTKTPKTPGDDKGKKMAGAVNGGGRPSTIHLTIQKLVGIETVRTSNMRETAKEAGQSVAEQILFSLQSVSAG